MDLFGRPDPPELKQHRPEQQPKHDADSRRINRRMPQQAAPRQAPPATPHRPASAPQQQPGQPSVWQLMQDENPEPNPFYEDYEPYEELPAKRKREKNPRKPREKKERPRGKRLVWWLAKRAIVCLVVLLVVAAGALAVYLPASTRNDDLWLTLEQTPYRAEGTVLYAQDRDGQWVEYTRFNPTQEREYVSSGDIPQQLKDAFVAIEDSRFYTHSGVDIKRTGYAVLNEIKKIFTGSYIGGGQKQGGSTITQQLIKNLTVDDEAGGIEGYLRKVREMYRAWKMEKDYTKDEILVAYLNTIGFTGNTAGVQAEAKKLFGRPVNELTLAESASLAAITRNPSRFNPHVNPELHIERRNYVLACMLDQGYISQGEYDAACAEGLNLMDPVGITYNEPMTSYFTDTVFRHVIQELVSQRGITEAQASNLIYNGGLRVYTTVDTTLQTNMESIMANNGVFPQAGAQAAMISLDYGGAIKAVVGGLGKKELRLDFDRASMAYRQTGSTMKAIAPYVLAIEKNKINWSTPIMDSAVMQVEDEKSGEKADWPRNVTQVYSGKDMLVVDAFAQSVNTVAVRVGQKVGTRTMYNFVKRDLGAAQLVRDDVDLGPMVLGSTTYGMTPLEMASAYSMFGNGGYVHTVHSFTHIQNGVGTTLLTVEVKAKRVISPETATIMNRLMGKVLVGNGSASGQRPAGEMDAVGKTGTTSDNVDHWFVGLTPYYVTAVWYGYDTPAALYNANRPPVTAWKLLMERSQQGLAYREFQLSSGVVEVSYCTVSGHRAGANCPSATGYYKQGEEPESGCPVHG